MNICTSEELTRLEESLEVVGTRQRQEAVQHFGGDLWPTKNYTYSSCIDT